MPLPLMNTFTLQFFNVCQHLLLFVLFCSIHFTSFEHDMEILCVKRRRKSVRRDKTRRWRGRGRGRGMPTQNSKVFFIICQFPLRGEGVISVCHVDGFLIHPSESTPTSPKEHLRLSESQREMNQHRWNVRKEPTLEMT